MEEDSGDHPQTFLVVEDGPCHCAMVESGSFHYHPTHYSHYHNNHSKHCSNHLLVSGDDSWREEGSHADLKVDITKNNSNGSQSPDSSFLMVTSSLL